MAFNRKLAINETRPHLDAVRYLKIHGFVDLDRAFNARFDAEVDRHILELELKPLPLEQAMLGALRNKVLARAYATTTENFAHNSPGEGREAFRTWVEQDGSDTGYMTLMAYRYSAEVLRRLNQATGGSTVAE